MSECREYLLLLDSDDNDAVRKGAFQAGEDMCVEAVPVLAKLLQTSNLGVQEAADNSLKKIGGKEVVQAVSPLLRSEDAPVRNLAMDILRKVGAQDMPSLIELIQDEDADIRIFVSDILGSTNNVLAVAPLCEALLQDPEVNVRYQAAVSLGELRMKEAAPCLNKAINDEEWVQYSVIEALTKIGDASSVEAMAKALPKASDLVASIIIDALGEMGNVKAVTMLLKCMDDAPVALRNKIVKAIVKILGGKSLTLLSMEERERFRQYSLVALTDEDEEIQDAAINGLAYVGGEPAARGILQIASVLNPEQDHDRLEGITNALAHIGVTEALKAGALDEDQNVARVAIQTLAQVSPQECESEHAVCKILMEAFWKGSLPVQRQIMDVAAELVTDVAKDFFFRILDEHTDELVLKSTVSLLGEKLQEKEAADKIFPLLQHPSEEVKEAALEACIAIGGPDVQERFKSMFESSDPIDRLMAVYALGKLDVLQNINIITYGLEDEIPDIRKVAVEALASSCTVSDAWKPLVLSRMTDENKEVRLTVVEALGECFSDDFVTHLVEALDDEDDWVKIRAVDVLGEQKIEQAVKKMISMLDNPNRFVVLKVIEALGNIGGEDAFRSLLKIVNSGEAELVGAAEKAIASIQES